MGPIQRPVFPAIVTQKPLIYGLNGKLTIKTCFCVEEALEVGSMVVEGHLQGDVLIELYGRYPRVEISTNLPLENTAPFFSPGGYVDSKFLPLE
jgi:hypothetical protein